MTRELLTEANKLSYAIDHLDAQISIAEDMHHCDCNLVLKADQIGSITIAWDDELKTDIIDMVLNRLNYAKDNMEDKLRLL